MKRSLKHVSRLPCVIAVVLVSSACAHRPPSTSPRTGGDAFAHTTAEERGTTVGGEDWFTGQTTVAMLFAPSGPRDFGGATVAFQSGARTRWHSHPAGQTLLVTEGTGWVQLEGEKRLEVKPGDVVWTPPGIRHWHGATPEAAMTHLALQGDVEGRTVDWFEPVTDASYLGSE